MPECSLRTPLGRKNYTACSVLFMRVSYGKKTTVCLRFPDVDLSFIGSFHKYKTDNELRSAC